MNFSRIRNFEGVREGFIDFSAFDGCFPNDRLSFTDLDGMMERKGNFLVLEKKGINRLTLGQKLLLKQLLALGVFTIIVFGPSEYKPEFITVYYPDGNMCVAQNPSHKELRRVISEWFKYADSHPTETFISSQDIIL